MSCEEVSLKISNLVWWCLYGHKVEKCPADTCRLCSSLICEDRKEEQELK